MHLPIGHPGHLGDFDDESNIHLEELHASRLQVDSGSGSEGSQGSRGSGGCIREKPVKVIPCPRCQSMNTKFCYYNNYSVNQPRHFCRNCQRYWTVGGTLRNVPVGGGSRKKTRSRSRSGNDNNNNNYFQTGVGPNPPPPGLANPGASPFPGLDTLRQLSMLSQSQQQHQVGLGFHGGQLGGLIPSPHSQIPFLQFGLEPTQGMSFSSQLLSKPEPTDHLHSLFETNSAGGLLQSNSGGYYMPEVEPSSHSEALATVMQKAGLWSNPPGNHHHHHHHHQVHQPCASEVAWEEMQSKSSPINPPAPGAFKFEETRASNLNSNSNSNSSNSSAVLHPPSKPGFWETALMHSRPPAMERPPPPGMHAWEDSAQHRSNNLSPHASSSTEEGGNSSTPSTGGYVSTGLYGDAAASPWGGLQLQQLNVPPEIYF